MSLQPEDRTLPYTGAMSAPASGTESDAALPNLPLLDDAITFDEMTDAGPLDKKPTWRGWIHAGTFPAAIVLGIILLVAANGAAAKISCTVFFVC